MADAAAAGGDAKKLPEGYVNKNSEKALLGVFSSAGYIDVGNKVRPERARAVGGNRVAITQMRALRRENSPS